VPSRRIPSHRSDSGRNDDADAGAYEHRRHHPRAPRAWTQEHYANGERLRPRPAGSPLVLVPDPTTLKTVRDLKMEILAFTLSSSGRYAVSFAASYGSAG